jgi:hypothetical protein
MSLAKRITLDEFIEEVWNIERVKIHIIRQEDFDNVLVDHYPYREACPIEYTLDQFLNERIYPNLYPIPSMVIGVKK